MKSNLCCGGRFSKVGHRHKLVYVSYNIKRKFVFRLSKNCKVIKFLNDWHNYEFWVDQRGFFLYYAFEYLSSSPHNIFFFFFRIIAHFIRPFQIPLKCLKFETSISSIPGDHSFLFTLTIFKTCDAVSHWT